MKKFKFALLLAILGSFIVASVAGASTINAKNWYNENSNVHTMQLWVNDPSVSIKSVKINNGQSTDGWTWRYVDDSRKSVIFSGPELDVQTLYSHLQFTAPSTKTDFAVEWAEVSKQTTLTGTNYYQNKNWYYTKGDISHTPTPIPGAVLIFGGGLSLLAFVRRRFARS
ncbi:hypothetical protein [Maridesulfovibrio sp. FT414]|uniref:hypothetical protein n=1 Tax=Maridesulfovibrio sp. FT414 TaxID=2979469 RepID=UPI003D80A2FA